MCVCVCGVSNSLICSRCFRFVFCSNLSCLKDLCSWLYVSCVSSCGVDRVVMYSSSHGCDDAI